MSQDSSPPPDRQTSRERLLAGLRAAAGPEAAAELERDWKGEDGTRADNASKQRLAAKLARGRQDGHEAEPMAPPPLERPRSGRDSEGIRKRTEASGRRNADRQRRYHAANRKHLGRYQQKLKSVGQPDAAPRGVPPRVWKMAQVCQADTTGKAHRRYLAELPPVIARRIRNAATLKGTPLERPISHPTARKTIVALVGLWMCSRRSGRNGCARVTTGIPLGMVDRWIIDPHRKRRRRPDGKPEYSRTHLTGRARGRPGVVLAGVESGALLKKQPPANRVHASDRGPSGFAFNQYHWPRYSLAGAQTCPAELEAEIRELQAPGLLEELGLAPPLEESTGPPG